MLWNPEGITPDDCYREAGALRARAAEAEGRGQTELARHLEREASVTEGFGDIMAGIRPIGVEGESGEAEPTDNDDDPAEAAVWWVLVDGHVFLNEPCAGIDDAIEQHTRTVDFLARRGVGRQRVSLVHVSRRYGRKYFTGS